MVVCVCECVCLYVKVGGGGEGEGVGGWVTDTEWEAMVVVPRQLTSILPAINVINLLKTT